MNEPPLPNEPEFNMNLIDRNVHDTSLIRELLKNSFDDGEFTILCYDHFSPVFDHFVPGMGRLVKIQLLIDYCKRHGKFNTLLSQIRVLNPYQFEIYEVSTLKADNLVSIPRKTIPNNNTDPIEITIGGDFSKLNLQQRKNVVEAFIGALASILEIPHEEISIKEIKMGSIILKMEIPSATVKKLMALYSSNILVTELGIQNIIKMPLNQPPESVEFSSDKDKDALHDHIREAFKREKDTRKTSYNSKKMYVGNLSFEATESQVRDLFAPYGEVESINMITDRDSGRFRGFCFVEMETSAANAAISALDNQDLDGRTLKVNEAKPREDRGGGGGGGGFRSGGGNRQEGSRRGWG